MVCGKVASFRLRRIAPATFKGVWQLPAPFVVPAKNRSPVLWAGIFYPAGCPQIGFEFERFLIGTGAATAGFSEAINICNLK